jgi:AcrR family transcriptional regulator
MGITGTAVDAAPGSGGPRSQRTRRTILEAARTTFAARGYERTTIRAVAAGAGIDPSLVMRYFGSKAGLFAAAAIVDVQAPDLRAVPPEDRAGVLVRGFVERWENPATHDSLVLLLRTAVTDDAVARQLEATLGELITMPLAATGNPRPQERAALIAAQLLGVALARHVLGLEPLASMPAERLIESVTPAVRGYLDLDDAAPADARRRRR